MNTRLAGELLLRPSTFARPLSCQTSSSFWRPSWTTQRCFNSSTPSSASQPPPRRPNEASDQPSAAEPTSTTPPSQSARDAPRGAPSSSTDTSALIDGLFSSAGMAPRRRSGGRQANSSDDMSAAQSRHTFGAAFSKPTPNLRPKALAWENMTMPAGELSSTPPPKAPAIREEDIIYPRLNATTGRTIELKPERGRDLVRGLSMLTTLMARNKVRTHFNKQKFHERPGLKRKRLKSERWRARFKVGFGNVCGRVTELTRKGW